MVEKGIIEESDQDIYRFGIQNGFIILLNLFTAFLIGLLTQKLPVVFVFTLSFMTLRSFSGGYHSESKAFCYICSNLVLLIPIYTIEVFEKVPFATNCCILVVACAVILLLSPMNSSKRTLDGAEKKHFGRRAKVILAVQIPALVILYSFGYMELAYAIYSSLVLIALFMLLGTAILKIQQNMEE